MRCWPWGVFSSWLASRDLRYSALLLLGESGACEPRHGPPLITNIEGCILVASVKWDRRRGMTGAPLVHVGGATVRPWLTVDTVRARFLSLAQSVSSDYAQPITGQVTVVTCPVIGRAQPELPRKRQETCPGLCHPCNVKHDCVCSKWDWCFPDVEVPINLSKWNTC